MHRYFFYTLILFLPTQLGYHFWPLWATVLGRRVDYITPTLYATDILIILVVGLWVIEFYIRHKFIIFNLQFLSRFQWIKQHGIIFLLVIMILGNVFTASNRPAAVYAWIKVVEFILLGWYIVKTKPSIAVITTLLSIGVFYASSLAIVQFFLQHSVGGMMWYMGERTFTAGTP